VSTQPAIPVYKLPEPAAGELRGMYNELPYIGPQLNLKTDDEKQKLPQLTSVTRAFVFHLGMQEHLDAYNEILQQVADGYTLISLEDCKYNGTTGSFDVMLRWITQYYIAPAEERSHAE
jgi:hypothetical protein